MEWRFEPMKPHEEGLKIVGKTPKELEIFRYLDQMLEESPDWLGVSIQLVRPGKIVEKTFANRPIKELIRSV